MSHHYLRFDDVHYRYPNGYEALCGVSFCITHGEKVALVGANGAGKSTLLLHTNGLLIPSQGEVVMGGIKLTRRTLPLVRQSVGLVFQDSDNQLFMPTVEEDWPSDLRTCVSNPKRYAAASRKPSMPSARCICAGRRLSGFRADRRSALR